jgi:hypothetical protein
MTSDQDRHRTRGETKKVCQLSVAGTALSLRQNPQSWGKVYPRNAIVKRLPSKGGGPARVAMPIPDLSFASLARLIVAADSSLVSVATLCASAWPFWRRQGQQHRRSRSEPLSDTAKGGPVDPRNSGLLVQSPTVVRDYNVTTTPGQTSRNMVDGGNVTGRNRHK